MTSQVMSQKEEHDSATWYKAQTPEGAGGNATEKNADAGPSRPIPDCQSYGYNAQLDPIPTSRPSIRVLTNKRPLPSTVPRLDTGHSSTTSPPHLHRHHSTSEVPRAAAPTRSLRSKNQTPGA